MKPLPITETELTRILTECSPDKPHRDPSVFLGEPVRGPNGSTTAHHGKHAYLGRFAIVASNSSEEAWICCEAAPASITEFFIGLDDADIGLDASDDIEEFIKHYGSQADDRARNLAELEKIAKDGVEEFLAGAA